MKTEIYADFELENKVKLSQKENGIHFIMKTGYVIVEGGLETDYVHQYSLYKQL